ncbi:MAG: hypothetical protein OEW45_14775, partial [Deltaproteobacteria bacterium]|nr:hypothetical protein [Deltaproteobacteria bacterium]
MKSHRMAVVAAVFVMASFLLYPLGWSIANAKVIQMRIAHYIDEKHPLHLGAMQFVSKVDERTKGQVKITIYP